MPASYNTTGFQSDGSVTNSLSAGQNTGGTLNPADASGLRLAGAGLTPGANGLLSDLAGTIFNNVTFMGVDGQATRPDYDWRVRVSMAKYAASLFYDNPANPIMTPLNSVLGTSGVIFPYTPAITITHSARYTPQSLTHSNYNSYFYDGSEVPSISIAGEFTVQNVVEGQYLMAVIQFFRSVTKMFFGADTNAGSPPPIVFLDGYGPTYLPHVPCVVTQFTHTMPAEVDYVQVPVGAPLSTSGVQLPTNDTLGGPVRLPTSSTVNLTLQPIYSRSNIFNNFTLDKFAKGALVRNGTSTTGGFL
jgi:hypothetical protein